MKKYVNFDDANYTYEVKIGFDREIRILSRSAEGVNVSTIKLVDIRFIILQIIRIHIWSNKYLDLLSFK